MVVSGNSGRIGRISSEIADLHRKDGRERRKAEKSRIAARRLLEEAGSSHQADQLRASEARAAHLERRARLYERRAAAFQEKIAEMGKKLRRAKASSRRMSDLLSGGEAGPTEKAYDVCLTFADEQRSYVKRVYQGLRKRGYRVFYDEATPTQVWGDHMTERFDGVFRKESRRCVMFISAEYLRKTWTKWERRSAFDRAREDDDYLLPARFDDTELPGLPPSVGYVDLRRYTPEQFVELVADAIGAPS